MVCQPDAAEGLVCYYLLRWVQDTRIISADTRCMGTLGVVQRI